MVDTVINVICIGFMVLGLLAIVLICIDLFKGDEK